MADDDADVSQMTQEELNLLVKRLNRAARQQRGTVAKTIFRNENQKLISAIRKRRREFKDIAEEENQASYTMTQAALDKIVAPSGGSNVTVNNVNNSPQTNNTTTKQFSPITQIDPVMKQAISSAL